VAPPEYFSLLPRRRAEILAGMLGADSRRLPGTGGGADAPFARCCVELLGATADRRAAWRYDGQAHPAVDVHPLGCRPASSPAARAAAGR
jgi:trehalose-6-phosphate synthase